MIDSKIVASCSIIEHSTSMPNGERNRSIGLNCRGFCLGAIKGKPGSLRRIVLDRRHPYILYLACIRILYF